MNITAIIYDADARRTAYILGTVIGNCKLFPAERAPRDWSGYANVITVTAGEDGPVVTAGLQMTGTAVYIDPLSDEYRSVIEARGVQLQQLQQMPAMLHAVRLDITRYELLDGALRADGYAARQVLDLG